VDTDVSHEVEKRLVALEDAAGLQWDPTTGTTVPKEEAVGEVEDSDEESDESEEEI